MKTRLVVDRLTGRIIKFRTDGDPSSDGNFAPEQHLVIEGHMPDTQGRWPHRVIQAVTREPVLEHGIQVARRIATRGAILRSGPDVKIENPETEAFMEEEHWPLAEKAKVRAFRDMRPTFAPDGSVTGWREMDAGEKAARDADEARIMDEGAMNDRLSTMIKGTSVAWTKTFLTSEGRTKELAHLNKMLLSGWNPLV